MPTLKTGRKWTAQGAVDAATENLRLQEVLGHTQTGRYGLGYEKKPRFWSKARRGQEGEGEARGG